MNFIIKGSSVSIYIYLLVHICILNDVYKYVNKAWYKQDNNNIKSLYLLVSLLNT